MLIRQSPSALIVPVSINNSWKMLKYGKFPYGIGCHLKFQVHDPIEIGDDPDKLISIVEESITKNIVV